MNTNAEPADTVVLKRQELLTVLGGSSEHMPGLIKPFRPYKPHKPYNPGHEEITLDRYIIEVLFGGKWIPLNKLPQVLPKPPALPKPNPKP
jgi:hypothetical protein